MSKQSKVETHIETSINMATGFLISFLVWLYIAGPLVQHGYLSTEAGGAFTITCIFTVTSYIRVYLWRRFFTNDIHKLIHEGVKKWMQK